MAEFESVVDYSTKLNNFEGPLDLLLHLIKEAKIEIKDIFVSQVTEQFLAYIENLDGIDIDKAGEYIGTRRREFVRDAPARILRREEAHGEREE